MPKNTAKTKTAKERALRRDALLLFNIIHNTANSADARYELTDWATEICGQSAVILPEHYRALFIRTFIEGWKAPGSQHARRVLKTRFLDKLKSGMSLDLAYQEYKREQGEAFAARREAERNAPEPKDKTSDEWRYWKIRQLTRAFTCDETGREEYDAAWEEFKALLNGLLADGNFWHTSNAIHLLPDLLIARQEIDRMNKRERKSDAAMKAAATRKARQQKRR
ncbi:MAG: hypothetical protein WBP93_18380 [Pyrinomonadaceae bacterium]